jgi:hypothetical protein
MWVSRRDEVSTVIGLPRVTATPAGPPRAVGRTWLDVGAIAGSIVAMM